MELRHIPFKKMNGLGNDFVIIDARAEPLRLSAAAAGAIANRAGGAGCDQVIVLEPSRAADVFMRILNADGSEVSACGNASRCVAVLLSAGLGRDRLTIETRAGVLDAEARADGLAAVDMGAPRFEWDQFAVPRLRGYARDRSHLRLARWPHAGAPQRCERWQSALHFLGSGCR